MAETGSAPRRSPIDGRRPAVVGGRALEPAGRGRRQRRPDPAADPDRRGDRPGRRVAGRVLRRERGLAAVKRLERAAERGRRGQLLRADPDRLRRRARPARSHLQRDAAPARAPRPAPARSSSRTRRTSCARRSSRWAASSSCSRTRTSTSRPSDEFVTTMREQVDRLQKLTTDLLDLSRLDADSMELELRAGRPADARERGRRRVRPQPPARTQSRLEVRGRRPGDALCRPRAGRADRPCADRQCAHPHPRGNQGERRPPRAAPIPPSCSSATTARASTPRPRPVFDRFHTGDTATGSGLGLAIARELATGWGDRSRSSPSGATPPSPCASLARGSGRPRPGRRGAAGRRSEARGVQPAALLAAASLTAAIVAGCGGDDGDGDSGQASTATATAPQRWWSRPANGLQSGRDLRARRSRRRHGPLDLRRAPLADLGAAAPGRAAAS